MAEPPVCTEGAQKGLLVGVVRRIPPETPPKLAQDGVAVLVVEAFKRRRMHETHHLL